jgi:hypothetical protein
VNGSNGCRANRINNSSLKAAAIIGSKKGWITAHPVLDERSGVSRGN